MHLIFLLNLIHLLIGLLYQVQKCIGFLRNGCYITQTRRKLIRFIKLAVHGCKSGHQSFFELLGKAGAGSEDYEFVAAESSAIFTVPQETLMASAMLLMAKSPS